MTAWHSAKVIEARRAEYALLQSKCRVAPFSPITRAYISHGWNCKHCRNCIYACRGVLKDPPDLDSAYGIRGPGIYQHDDFNLQEDDI